MPRLGTIKLTTTAPKICVSITGETIADIRQDVTTVMQEPVDILEFKSGTFNGVSNFSQLWNALLTITRYSDEAPLLFSCCKDELPDYFRTDKDYADILRFAIRTALVDGVLMDVQLPQETRDDIIDRALTAGIVPIPSYTATMLPTTTDIENLFAPFLDDDVRTFHLTAPVHDEGDVAALEEAIQGFTTSCRGTTILFEPTGMYIKEMMANQRLYVSPVMYAAIDDASPTLPSCRAVRALLDTI